MDSAASLLSFARVVNDIVENATTMPGDPLAEIALETLEPLVSLASETTVPVSYEPRLPEEGLVWPPKRNPTPRQATLTLPRCWPC